MTAPWRRWDELTTKDFAALDAERAVAVLPVAATEQHGPHLPLSVDARINRGILEAALSPLQPDLTVLVLPEMPVGKSDEHLAFPGTLSLSAETVIRLWTEIGECVHNAGLRKLLIFNSHGGQPQIMDIVARDLRVRLSMFAVTCSWFALGLPEGLFGDHERTHGIHGGGIETSMMLHLAPDLVRREEIRDFPSLSQDLARDFRFLTPEGQVGFGWQAQDLNQFGGVGDARDADAVRGRALVEHAADALAVLIAEIDRFPLDLLKDRV